MGLFGPTIQATIQLSIKRYDGPISDRDNIKECEEQLRSFPHFKGGTDNAAEWFQRLCTLIVRCRVDRSKLHSILSTRLREIAYTWYTRKLTEFAKVGVIL